jgi:hypothetical protein
VLWEKLDIFTGEFRLQKSRCTFPLLLRKRKFVSFAIKKGLEAHGLDTAVYWRVKR